MLCSGSSAPALVIGEAGIVLKRFLSARLLTAAFREELSGRERAVTAGREVLGVAGTFRVPIGLAVPGRDAVEGARVVRLAGVADTVLVLAMRSELAVEARDILLGLAEIPSLLFSSPDGFSSTELTDCRFGCVAAPGVNVVVLVGLRTVAGVGRAGGLVSELAPTDLAAEEAAVGLVAVDNRGVVVLVKGFVDGLVALGLTVEVGVSSPLEEACLSMRRV